MLEYDSRILDQAYLAAQEAAVIAGRKVLEYWPNPVNPNLDTSLKQEVFEKQVGVGNFSTTADHESEALIVATIRQYSLLKNLRIVGEEGEKDEPSEDFWWNIDPIDGTIPFNNGLPEFGISIALLRGNVPLIGVIAMPALDAGQMMIARRGKGAKLLDFQGDVLIEDLSKLAKPDIRAVKALVGFDIGYEDREEQLQTLKMFADKMGALVSYMSSSTAMFRIALGELKAFFYGRPTIYDIGAASVIIPERGGKISDMQGNPIDFFAPKRSVLAAMTPVLHQELVGIING